MMSRTWRATVAACALPAAVGIVVGGDRVVIGAVGIATVLTLVRMAWTQMLVFCLALLVIRAAIDSTRVGADGGLVASSGIATSVVSLLLIGAAAAWFVVRWHAGIREPLPAVALGAVGLLGAATLSALLSPRPAASLPEAARLASAVAMLLVLITTLRSLRDVRRVLQCTYASSVVPLMVAAAQMVMGSSDGRLRGTFWHPNAFGAYLALLLVMAIALLPSLDRRNRTPLGILSIAMFLALVATYSRGSWIGATVGLVIVALVQRRAGLIVVVASTIVLLSLVPAVVERTQDLSEGRTLRGTGGNSLLWRIDYWRTALDLTGDRPGTGIGLRMVNFETSEGNNVHNDFVRIYVEAGWVGLLSLVWLLLVLAATAARAVRRSTTSQHLAVSAGFAGSLGSMTMMMAGGNVITTVVVLWYFFAIAAAGHAIAERGAAVDSAWSRPLVRLSVNGRPRAGRQRSPGRGS